METRADTVASFINTTSQSDSQLLRKIEGLAISADAKAVLADLLKLASKVGEQVLRIGRKLIDFVLSLMKHFPTLTFTALVAVVVAMLLAAVPVLGAVIGPALAPLAAALGIAWGAKAELDTPDLAERVRAFAAGFSGLAA
jgi:hypothetical protein